MFHLAGCGDDMEGIVLEVYENEIQLAENLTPNKYEEIKNDCATNGLKIGYARIGFYYVI